MNKEQGVPNKGVQATAAASRSAEPETTRCGRGACPPAFGHGGAGDDPERDRIAKILADAQRRGHRVPDFISTSNNLAQVSRWWAALADPAVKDR